MLDGPKVYVTGVAGMIGSNLARELVGRGRQVVGIDNLWRGTKANVADLLSGERFTFRHADLASDDEWFRDMEPRDELIHVADVVAGIGYVFSHEWSVFRRNLLINTAVARVVNERGPSRFIYLGTACSYPQELQRTVDTSRLSEDQKFPASPESGYGWSKLLGDIEFRLAVQGTATQYVVLDLHNVYGWPCVYSDHTAQVIPALIFKAMTSPDGRLVVWGDGRQGRAFLHVSDAVSAVVSALEYTGPISTFMIGPSFCTTIADVAEIIRRHPAMEIADIVFDTSKPTGDIGRFADATLANRELGWAPGVDFESGVRNLIDRILIHARTVV